MRPEVRRERKRRKNMTRLRNWEYLTTLRDSPCKVVREGVFDYVVKDGAELTAPMAVIDPDGNLWVLWSGYVWDLSSYLSVKQTKWYKRVIAAIVLVFAGYRQLKGMKVGSAFHDVMGRKVSVYKTTPEQRVSLRRLFLEQHNEYLIKEAVSELPRKTLNISIRKGATNYIAHQPIAAACAMAGPCDRATFLPAALWAGCAMDEIPTGRNEMKTKALFLLAVTVILSGCGSTTRTVPIQTRDTINAQTGELIASSTFVLGQEYDPQDPGSAMISSGVNLLFAEKGFELLPDFWSISDDEYAWAQIWNGSLINWHNAQRITIYNPADQTELVTFNPVPFPWHAVYTPTSSAERLGFNAQSFITAGIAVGTYGILDKQLDNNQANIQSANANAAAGFNAGSNATLTGVQTGAGLVGGQ